MSFYNGFLKDFCKERQITIINTINKTKYKQDKKMVEMKLPVANPSTLSVRHKSDYLIKHKTIKL